MKVGFSDNLDKEFKKIKETDNRLFINIEKKLSLFQQNPKHPSLRLHQLSGNLNNLWSISITMNFRMIYKLIDKNTAYFTKMGTHDEVYNK